MEEAIEATYRLGDRVQVRADSPTGHCRTPLYIRGKIGHVTAYQGSFLNPEFLAYGYSGLPQQPLYSVEFPQSEMWENYVGSAEDKISIDIYQHWLHPA